MTFLDAAGPRSKRDFVNSLSRGLDVMRCFDSVRPSMTLSEVAERSGVSRAGGSGESGCRRHPA